MKTIKFLCIIAFAVLQFNNSYSQSSANSTNPSLKLDTIKVSGNCESCKKRIEKAAKLNGVEKANWNEETKMLIVEYNPAIVNNDDIQKKVASKGHDTQKYKADDKVYNNLPGCCKYR
jgi:periplasmic mercuric ion binding protein